MFASTALFPNENFPDWMKSLSNLNPISYSSNFGREIIISGNNSSIDWIYFVYLLVFAFVMIMIGITVATRTLKIE